MTNTEIQIDKYLQRIGVTSPVTVSEEFVSELHQAQVYTIPFENFDVILDKAIPLDVNSLVEKMIHNERGGYCFELNGLFIEILKAIGFDCRPLLGCVHISGIPTGNTHQLTLLNINNRSWIADVGFGHNGLRTPIPLETNTIHQQDGYSYRLVDSDRWGYMLQGRDDEWKNMYSFTLSHVCQEDIEIGNYFTSTHPRSFFTQTKIASLPNSSGRISVMDNQLTVEDSSNITKTNILTGEDYLRILKDKFGIKLSIDPLTINPGE